MGRSVQDEAFAKAAQDLYRRLNPNLQRLLRFLVENYQRRKFTWEDVARDMGREVGTVKSWHRSLSKPLGRLVRQHPSAPPLLAGSWDGSRNQYSVSPEWRAAIRGV